MLDFQALWDCYTQLRTPGVLKGQVYGKLDPALFCIRKVILERIIRELLEHEVVEDLSIDAKKLALRRMSRALWKGYLLVLASERVGGKETLLGKRFVDVTFFRSSYEAIASRHLVEREGFPASLAMTRAIELVVKYERGKLTEDLGELGDAAIVLNQAIERLVRSGYLLALVQKGCLGEGVRFAETAESREIPVW